MRWRRADGLVVGCDGRALGWASTMLHLALTGGGEVGVMLVVGVIVANGIDEQESRRGVCTARARCPGWHSTLFR